MKSVLLFIIAITICAIMPASAQKWVSKMQDHSSNFYDVQKAFNKEWKAKEAEMLKERGKKGTSTKEEEPEGGYAQYKRWEYFIESRVYPTGNRLKPSIAAENY